MSSGDAILACASSRTLGATRGAERAAMTGPLQSLGQEAGRRQLEGMPRQLEGARAWGCW